MSDALTLRLARDPSSIKQARDSLRALPELDGRADDARLLISELVTNAIRYGEGNIRLDVLVDDDHARMVVSDDGVGDPQMVARPGQHGGWGLRLVDSLADRWGVLGGSTQVWAELAL
ncbi:MAG TPA: ATP-binding protein [Solirubrobacteraceae bacterium]|nr:ATP-binding protein [Solirubrobacteraceae bacterium]